MRGGAALAAMRIGLFTGRITPKSGGGFTFERELLEALQMHADGTEHTITVFGLEAARPMFLDSPRIAYVSLHMPTVQRAWRLLQRLGTAFLRKLRDLRAPWRVDGWADDILAEHNVQLLWYLSPFDTLTREGPYIITVWDLQHRLQPYFPEVSVRGAWQWREGMYSSLLPPAALVITGTETGRREVETFYQVPSQRIRVLALPTPRFALEAAARTSGRMDVLDRIPAGYLFYPAVFWPHKNQVTLLLAAKVLREKYGKTYPVVLVGYNKGNQGHIQRLAAEWGLTGQVHFLGFVSREELAALYRRAFALVFPTFFGPDNLPPLEAFALGCPVIASDVSGAREQLGDAALLFDPADAEQLAEKILLLENDPALRATLLERGRKRAAQWSGADYVKKMFSIFDEFEKIRRCWP